MSNHHPTKRITAPDGSRPAIDVMLVPLMKALWAAGYETIGSCQDLGEALRDHPRKAAYWDGYALLEMPTVDALRLVDVASYAPQLEDRMHWAAEGAWEVSLPVTPKSDQDGGADILWAQVHFPNDQIDDLIKAIAEA